MKLSCKGFTLVEIIVAIVISGLLAAITLPSFAGFINRGRLADAQNNLLAIYAAQKAKFSQTSQFYDSGASTCNATTVTNDTGINAGLGLTIFSNGVNYCCEGSAATFTCLADTGTYKMQLDNANINLVSTELMNSATRNPRCTATGCPAL